MSVRTSTFEDAATLLSNPITSAVSSRLGMPWSRPSKAQIKASRRVAKALVFTICLVPFAWLVWEFFQGQLGVNPIQTLLRELGDWALRFLLIGLAITPVKIVTGWGEPMHYRRMIGLFAFFYAVLHLASYVGLDQFFEWQIIGEEIVKRPFITIGMIGVALLIPLAVTSTSGMVKRLGARRWKMLHRAVYVVGALGVVHFYMMIKADFSEPIIYGAILAVLLGVRGMAGLRRAAKRRSRSDFGERSPMLEHTRSGAQTAETIAAEPERNVYVPYEIFDVRPESEAITSFYLRRADGKAPPSYEPGQFLPIRLAIPGKDAPATRTYTLSDAPNAEHYRLSIKREGGTALVSNFLHDHAKPGFRLEAMAPRGKFVLDQSNDRPVVLLSAGVGITPMIAMTNFIIAEGLRTRKFRRTYFIHGAQNGQMHAFGDPIRELAAKHDSLTAHIRFNRPSETDRLGETYDSQGYVDIELLKSVLPLDDYDFYLCGPQPFMQAIYDGLTELGVRDERIDYESFGPATVLKHGAKPKTPPAKVDPVDGAVAVRFAASDIELSWTADTGTLLDLAEAAGLAPESACRSGVCGTCATRIKCGAVDYIEEPSAPHGDDEVLMCCATPRPATGEASCGKDRGVVLEL